MDEWVKVHEEVVNESEENPKSWLNEILDDEAIPYKNEIVKDNSKLIILGGLTTSTTILEVYVYKSDYDYVMELIKEYNDSNISNDCEELNNFEPYDEDEK